MNEMNGEIKGTRDTLRNRVRALEIAAPLLLATLAILYDRFVKQFSIQQLVVLTISVIAVWLLAAVSAAWFYSRPRDLLNDLRRALDRYQKQGDQLSFELKATLREALASQPYVSEDVLSIIESDATNIWVISTDLRNDVTPGKIRESVESNLKSGKKYIYFLPSPTNPNFPDAASNEHSFRTSQMYFDHRDQIRIIHLPDNTLFLFREVVVYNPLPDPNNKVATVPKGFTYFESNSGDQLVKIPDSYLQFLKGQLHRYAEDIGLQSEIEKLIPELRNRLVEADFGYLGKLIGQRRIEARQEFKQFLASVRQRDPDAATTLENVLGRYVEPIP